MYKNSSTIQSRPTLNPDKPIKFVSIVNTPPFSFHLPDGTPTGFYIEFWELWSETNKIPIDIKLSTFEVKEKSF